MNNTNPVGVCALPDQSGEIRKFSDIVGAKGAVLYIYPKDNTPGCSVEAGEFNALLDEFKRKGFSIIGISKDPVKSHAGFAKKFGLNFTLWSDSDLSLIDGLGAYGEKSMYGKILKGVKRSTFVLDREGRILKTYENVKAQGHAAKVLSDLDSL